jgi:hypothetical protein
LDARICLSMFFPCITYGYFAYISPSGTIGRMEQTITAPIAGILCTRNIGDGAEEEAGRSPHLIKVLKPEELLGGVANIVGVAHTSLLRLKPGGKSEYGRGYNEGFKRATDIMLAKWHKATATVKSKLGRKRRRNENSVFFLILHVFHLGVLIG